MISSGSFVAQTNRKGIDPAKLLEEHRLPSITGSAASGPMSPSPKTAVPSVTTATVLTLDGQVKNLIGILGDDLADACDLRGIDQTQKFPRMDGNLAHLTFDLSPPMEIWSKRSTWRMTLTPGRP